MKKIGILLISTGKYEQFIMPLLTGLDKNFLKDHQRDVRLFTDSKFAYIPDSLNVIKYKIPSYKFPYATLYRYKIFSDHAVVLSHYDYLYYLDVDMAIESEVGEEIFGDLTGVRHPGFYTNNGWGSESNDPNSLSYIGPEHQKKYFAGGFQGGAADKYLTICKDLAEKIQNDESRGVMAQWHDETFWNYALNFMVPKDFPDWKITELTPSYCTVPSIQQRIIWGIQDFPAKIVALDKNHSELRS